MFPVAFDVTRIAILLIGSGELLKRRLAQLQDAHATRVTIFEGKLPNADDIKNHHVIMVAGLERAQSETIAKEARGQGKLVNVEDVNELCDFFFTANVRRGKLLIAVSTGGASPTLARKVRDKIAALFGAEWAGRTDELAHARLQWKAQGAGMKEVLENTERYLEDKGWLKDKAA